jgi:phthalate 4,5-dioxygenase oxygenase subunit
VLSKEDNDLLTRVCGDAPLGRLMRDHCWIPGGLSSQLVAGGAPLRVRLLGEDFVAFRTDDGRMGFFDEACPHRGASLALARNEDNALRCIFHGWKFDVDGRCLEVPTQGVNHDGFCRNVRVKHYSVREAAGVFWVFLGHGEAPSFHEFEFLQLATPTHVFITLQKVGCNWLQLVETTMDSSHLGILHATNIKALGDVGVTTDYTSPIFETEHKPYGFQYAAIRQMNGGEAYVRLNTFVAPWFSLLSPVDKEVQGGAIQFTVPIDDEHSLFFFGHYRRNGVGLVGGARFPGMVDPADYPPLPPGGPDTNWGQDRDAMKQGHWSGFKGNFVTEDLAVSLSAKKIVDRTKEQLNAADAAIVNVRRSVLQAIREYMSGEVPACARRVETDEASIIPLADFVPENVSWREHFRNAGASIREHAPATR